MSMKYFLSLIILFGFYAKINAQESDAGKLYTFISQYQADIGSLDRRYQAKYSPEYFERMKKFYADWLDKLGIINYNELNVSESVDYILLKRNIRNDFTVLKESEKLFNEVSYTVPFSSLIYEFEKTRRFGSVVNGKEIASLFNQLKKEIEKAEDVVEKKPVMSEVQSKKAVEVVKNLQNVLKESYSFYYGYDPLFTWWAEQPFKEVDTVLSSYSDFLAGWKSDNKKLKDDGSGIIGNPIGQEALIRLLDFEMIPYSPDELIQLANKEFAWCDAEMLKASNEMGLGNEWKKAIEKVKNQNVDPGKQPELIKFLAEEAVQFVEANKLLTVPDLAKEDWGMTMMTPKQQLYNPFFLGGEDIQISFPTNTMSQEAKLMSIRGNNIHFSRATVFHELIPGHHLQMFMMQRYKPYRWPFETPFWMEGWALYWEMLLWDKHFQKTPEDRVGALFWRMHRCARIIFSLSYHTGKWTPQQCIDFLVDRVGHERANAEAEVRRSFTGGYGPLYQIAYMLGGLQLKQLHKDLVESGKMTDLDFHDAILHENSIPIEMVRAELTNQKPNQDFKTLWKFYGNLK